MDPLATSSSLIVFGAYGGLQLKISRATSKRLERDAAAETLRKARVLLLAGKMTTDEVERVAASWQEAAEVYERERVIFGLQGVQLRLPDPSRAVEPENDVAADAEEEGAAEQPAAMQEQQQRRAEGDALTPVRRALGLRDAGAARSSSLLPTGSARVTIKDVAIGLVFLLQLGWLALSLTDPLDAPGQNPVLNAALTSGGEMVDKMEARRAAQSEEYRAMLQAAIDAGEAPPLCATLPPGEPGGGCAGRAAPSPSAAADPDFQRSAGGLYRGELPAGPPQ